MGLEVIVQRFNDRRSNEVPDRVWNYLATLKPGETKDFVWAGERRQVCDSAPKFDPFRLPSVTPAKEQFP